jgi:quercetin dioxygenase-like cupin family protein
MGGVPNYATTKKEGDMKRSRITAFAMLIIGVGLVLHFVWAQQEGVKRTDLQKHDLSIPGREVVQVRVDLGPGVVAPKHKHPGEEIIYVIEGSLQYEVEGQAATTLKAGDVLFVPAGVVHSVKNVGTDKGAELATYIVEKGKPLVVTVK